MGSSFASTADVRGGGAPGQPRGSPRGTGTHRRDEFNDGFNVD